MTSSRPYRIFVDTGAFYSPGGDLPLPDELKSGIRDALEELAKDPFVIGRDPPSPPYHKVGLFYDFKIRFEGQRYAFAVLFLADQKRHAIFINHINMFPAYKA